MSKSVRTGELRVSSPPVEDSRPNDSLRHSRDDYRCVMFDKYASVSCICDFVVFGGSMDWVVRERRERGRGNKKRAATDKDGGETTFLGLQGHMRHILSRT
jgi:hypothetical protein